MFPSIRRLRVLGDLALLFTLCFFPALASAQPALTLDKLGDPATVVAGENLTYTITLVNTGTDPATTVVVSDSIPAGTTFVSVIIPSGWSAVTPPVGLGGVVSITNPSVAAGLSSTFTLVVNVDGATADGTVITNTATATSTNAASPPDAVATNSVSHSADLQVTKSASPNPIFAGDNLTFDITVVNNGASSAETLVLLDSIPPHTTFVSMTAPPFGWTVMTPAVGNTGDVTATNVTLDVGLAQTFTLVVKVDAGVADGTLIENTATISSITVDPNPDNNSFISITGIGLPPVSIDDVTVSESDGEAIFFVTIPFISDNTVSVDFATADGSATAPADYTATSDTAIIPSGETQTTIMIPLNDEKVVEGNETFSVNLSNPQSATLGDANGIATITDNDATAGADISSGGCELGPNGKPSSSIASVLLLIVIFFLSRWKISLTHRVGFISFKKI